ncbi:MAG: DUF1460 domain-containing protein [Tatlockia sp.]|nr:DUF1460 domain-containing protein [Tatlockia sp.]
MSLVYLRKTLKWIAFSSFLLILTFQLEAQTLPIQHQADVQIQSLYQKLEKSSTLTMAKRIENFSAEFIGKPYLLGALGEGSEARFDQYPQYRTDAFDCDTYVTTVLALALAANKQGFQHCLAKIRYKNGNIDFLSRNHFISMDWNPNNQNQHFIKDITSSIKNRNNQSIVKIALALIDKPSWYQRFSQQKVRLQAANETEQNLRLVELKQRGTQLQKRQVSIPYIPLSALFNHKAHPDLFIFAQIPHAAIIEIVRPNWNLREIIGTNLNVSHLGFAIWKNNTLFFRQASSQYGKVIDVPLIPYLKEALASPTIKGINIEIVLPQTPLDKFCSWQSTQILQ